MFISMLGSLATNHRVPMAPDSSRLAWKILWTEEPGGPPSMGSLWVRHNWVTSLSLFTFMHWRRKWQPPLVFLPGEPRDGGAWWAAVYGVAQSWPRLKWLSSSSSRLAQDEGACPTPMTLHMATRLDKACACGQNCHESPAGRSL